MRTRRLLAVATASVLFAALTACGEDSTPAADESPDGDASSSQPAESDDSAEPTEPAEPTDEEEQEEETGGYNSQELLAAMKAAVTENESAHITLEISQSGQAMTGEGDVSYTGDSTSMQIALKAPGMGAGTIEMRLVEEVVYMAAPPMTPPGKFLKMDTNDPNSPFGDLGNVTGGDPLATFEAFDAGLQKAEYIGAEEVDGESMDHYVLTVDAKKAAMAQGSEVPPGTPKTVIYDLWIDGEDLMRRIEFTQAATGLAVTMDDWGKPVSVQVPPPADIVKMPGAPS